MRGLGTDHVISGPMKGLKKTSSDGANGQMDMVALCPMGLIQWNFKDNFSFVYFWFINNAK